MILLSAADGASGRYGNGTSRPLNNRNCKRTQQECECKNSVKHYREPFFLPRFTVFRALSRRWASSHVGTKTRRPYSVDPPHMQPHYSGNTRVRLHTLRPSPWVTCIKGEAPYLAGLIPYKLLFFNCLYRITG